MLVEQQRLQAVTHEPTMRSKWQQKQLLWFDNVVTA